MVSCAIYPGIFYGSKVAHKEEY